MRTHYRNIFVAVLSFSEPDKSLAGDALVCKYKSAAVAFNPNNLRLKQ